MNYYHHHSLWKIWFSFLIAIMLNIILSCIPQINLFYPSWINLILIYWVMTLPHQASVNTGFILGFVMDLIFGSILGIHALALSILAYLVDLKFQSLRNMVLWQQIVMIILLSLTTEVIIFLIEYLVIKTHFRPAIFLSSIENGLLWPWVIFIMNKTYCRSCRTTMIK